MDVEGEGLEDILRAANVEEIDVVGIAESHCVKGTALDGLKAGWPASRTLHLTVPVSEELGEDARHEMDEAGIEQLTTAEAFGFTKRVGRRDSGEDEYDPVDQFADTLAEDDTRARAFEDDYDDGDFCLDEDGPSNTDDEFDLAGRIQVGLFGAGASAEALGDYGSDDEDPAANAQDNADRGLRSQRFRRCRSR